MRRYELCAIGLQHTPAKQSMLTSICTIPRIIYGVLPVMETNKIRMDYIETELAKRHKQQMPADTANPNISAANQARSDVLSTTVALQREPASLGKLHEIDLGQETKLQNIARTEAATKRLVGDDRGASPAYEDSTPSIAASGKDGKPWRNRKRRNSEDIERDRLVEEVLRESKCMSCVLELQGLCGLLAHC